MLDVSGKPIFNKQVKSRNVTEYTLKNIALSFKREPDFSRVTSFVELIGLH